METNLLMSRRQEKGLFDFATPRNPPQAEGGKGMRIKWAGEKKEETKMA